MPEKICVNAKINNAPSPTTSFPGIPGGIGTPEFSF